MLTVLSLGVVVFPGLFVICNKALNSHFRNWNDAEVVQLSGRVVSTVHAILATISGVIIVTSCAGNVMTDRHRLATDFVWFGAPYMAYDIYVIYVNQYYKEKAKGIAIYNERYFSRIKRLLLKDILIVIHHVALLTIFMPVVLFFRRGLGDFFIGCFFTTELSTPFLNLGKTLIQLGLEDSKLHKINGLMVLLSFFTCRILLFPFMYWVYGCSYNIPILSVPYHIPLHCNIGNICLLAPQVYWFSLLCRKACRLYSRQNKPQRATSKDSLKSS
ncbi:TLC domain-containing protein 3A [Chanos chanos]|uniref:TLC domain-containing protein 3A n=1 Tax=Chanos chanos TaxID=29144 RepID=A0A6J2VLS4_CHACN|nr:TLC domain-containing protein 3A-like [Chanos chanos]